MLFILCSMSNVFYFQNFMKNCSVDVDINIIEETWNLFESYKKESEDTTRGNIADPGSYDTAEKRQLECDDGSKKSKKGKENNVKINCDTVKIVSDNADHHKDRKKVKKQKNEDPNSEEVLVAEVCDVFDNSNQNAKKRKHKTHNGDVQKNGVNEDKKFKHSNLSLNEEKPANKLSFEKTNLEMSAEVVTRDVVTKRKKHKHSLLQGDCAEGALVNVESGKAIVQSADAVVFEEKNKRRPKEKTGSNDTPHGNLEYNEKRKRKRNLDTEDNSLDENEKDEVLLERGSSSLKNEANKKRKPERGTNAGEETSQEVNIATCHSTSEKFPEEKISSGEENKVVNKSTEEKKSKFKKSKHMGGVIISDDECKCDSQSLILKIDTSVISNLNGIVEAKVARKDLDVDTGPPKFSFKNEILKRLQEKGTLSRKTLEKKVFKSYKKFMGQEVDDRVIRKFNKNLKKIAEVEVNNDIITLKE